ncbi:S-adenosyl-L-methionine-dependent methyltransferase [Trichophaea hybrida]|nr:S-adenosyl-L-methionine-dependent methyltransferase [Trichophaea hybrida]
MFELSFALHNASAAPPRPIYRCIHPASSPSTLLTMSASEAALLYAASTHNLPLLRRLLKTTSAQTQDPTTLSTPLHAAVSSLSPTSPPSTLSTASETIKLLLSNGAIWNDLNAAGETPGCIAWKNGASECYELLVDAGVRAEMLLGRMAGWGVLDSDDEEEEGEGEEKEPKDADVNTDRYLSAPLTYDAEKLVDEDANGVMMAWETGIMQRSVEELLPPAAKGMRVLNVGFGMGIVDAAFQARLDGGKHVIVEAHPDVLAKMEKDGWMQKPGVAVLQGRWQEALAPLLETGEVFDAIYFDTFAEEYSSLKTFFSEFVIALLAEGGRFSFFHGLGADRRVSWDVYTRVVELDLLDAGLDTTWIDVEIDVGDEEWKGVRRRYWDVGGCIDCRFVGLLGRWGNSAFERSPNRKRVFFPAFSKRLVALDGWIRKTSTTLFIHDFQSLKVGYPLEWSHKAEHPEHNLNHHN